MAMRALSTEFVPLSHAHVRSTPSSLIFTEKVSFTGDGATVTDAQGVGIFSVKAKAVSASARRELIDTSGKVVAGMRLKKSPGLHRAVYIGPENDEKLITVKTKDSMKLSNNNVAIFVHDNEVGEALGNWRSKTFEVKINGETAATMTRKSKTAAGIMFGADMYLVEVAPKCDISFVALLVCALDELFHDKPN
mmetsp:Transcript_6944/g.18610  ORF Transcript_6944/g.18610 Transcript_6944/m.18610 type:complete len:193 (+) Transcript_6944:620-1198(+)